MNSAHNLGKMNAGFIGLGRMGRGMARRIFGAGHDLVVYDVEAVRFAFDQIGRQCIDHMHRTNTVREAIGSDVLLQDLWFHQVEGIVLKRVVVDGQLVVVRARASAERARRRLNTARKRSSPTRTRM